MSGKIFLSDRRKVSLKKSVMFINKENAYEVVQSGKVFDGKTDGCKKKGLAFKVDNHTIQTTSESNTSTSIGKFPIYVDDYDETASDRSRSRVRKNVCRKETKTKQDSKTLANTNFLSTKVQNIRCSPDLLIVRRTRSSSNSRQISSDKMAQMNKLFQNRRSVSEIGTNALSLAHYGTQFSSQPIKHISNDVKKRTFSSIEMWKDKMRKSHTGTIPKCNKVQNKTKLQKSNIGPLDLQVKKSINVQNYSANKNVKKSELKDVLNTLKAMSSDICAVIKDATNDNLKVQMDTASLKTNSQSDKKVGNTTPDNFNAVTPSGGLPFFSMISPKMRREKCALMEKPLCQEKNNIFEETYVDNNFDYLKYVPDTEREREKHTPRLSSRFLRENVNAEQRRVIVGYMIRLGVRCHYSSSVIYQTIKLFNIAIDRIVVKTNYIQLIALACLWITLKHEAPDVKIPTGTFILQLAKDMYTNEQKALSEYERKILSAVNFKILFADPFSLLSYYILNVNSICQCNIVKPNDIVRIYFCGSYMIDLSMLDESLCDIPTYVIAIAAVELSLYLVYLNDVNVNVNEEFIQTFRSKQSLTEWEKMVTKSTKQLMIQRSFTRDKFYSNVIDRKYSHKEYGKVSSFVHVQINNLLIEGKNTKF